MPLLWADRTCTALFATLLNLICTVRSISAFMPMDIATCSRLWKSNVTCVGNLANFWGVWWISGQSNKLMMFINPGWSSWDSIYILRKSAPGKWGGFYPLSVSVSSCLIPLRSNKSANLLVCRKGVLQWLAKPKIHVRHWKRKTRISTYVSL